MQESLRLRITMDTELLSFMVTLPVFDDIISRILGLQPLSSAVYFHLIR